MVDQPSSHRTSPCDSLSPLDGTPSSNNNNMKLVDQDMFGDVIGFIHHEKLLDDESQLPSATTYVYPAAGSRSSSSDEIAPPATALPEQTQREASTTCPDPVPQPGCTVPAGSKVEEACSPRSPLISRTHRPSDLTLTRSNGLTTTSTPDLRRRICDARTAPDATRFQIQLPRPKAAHVPPTPGTPSPLFVMGNNASSLVGGAPANDGASMRSVVSRLPAPMRMLRKSSANLLWHGRRHDSKHPISSGLTTAAVIQVQQQSSVTSLDVTALEESDAELAIVKRHSPDELHHVIPSHSTSTETIVKTNPSQDLMAARTLPESSTANHIQPKQENRSPRKQSKSESDLRKQATLGRRSALSPSIPAPSPLPEDSPHKYGLKDRIDTPDLAETPKLHVVQARRRSSGAEIFHEAKSLQSASSFLNGLSTSRRRAESLQGSSESALTSQNINRTAPNHRSSRPNSALHHAHFSDRCRGHKFKPSGFAYARPLAPAQLQCYRNHMRLIPSSNKRCPVECAVCHIDDDREHFSCSWCALRMCRFCRKEFGENGMVALRERVRQAEFCGRSDGDEVVEALGEGGGRAVKGRG